MVLPSFIHRIIIYQSCNKKNTQPSPAKMQKRSKHTNLWEDAH